MNQFLIQELGQANREWANHIIKEEWSSTTIITREKIHYANMLPGFIALHNDKPSGLLIYKIQGNECEIIALKSLVQGIGIGSALINTAKKYAISQQCQRLWLITSNDNIPALYFYQKRGF